MCLFLGCYGPVGGQGRPRGPADQDSGPGLASPCPGCWGGRCQSLEDLDVASCLCQMSSTSELNSLEQDPFAHESHSAGRLDGLLGLRSLTLHLGKVKGQVNMCQVSTDFLITHLLILDGVEVNLTHPVHRLLLFKGDKAEAAVALRLLVHQHHRLLHTS